MDHKNSNDLIWCRSKQWSLLRLILDPNDSSLSYNGRRAIIYQRSFILEEDWRTETEWDIRRKLERSTAILTSNVHSELASFGGVVF
uniref:GSH_synthase domain-containing protein n=1 Tax=Globodera pallida TaxID=36090 RepID=A0A183CG90_GLOPA